jgi:hypothetical protein
MASTPGGLDGALFTGTAVGGTATGVAALLRFTRLLGGAARTGSSATKAKSSWLLVNGLPGANDQSAIITATGPAEVHDAKTYYFC